MSRFARLDRLPPYVFATVNALKMEARRAGEDIIDLGVGNPEIIAALRRIKCYLDYGIFQPIQIASIIALNGEQECVARIRDTYQERRDALISGLSRIGWSIPAPKGTMFVWAKIPAPYRSMGSVEFSKMMIRKAGVAVAPGLGFGEYGDDFVRFALIENNNRINQAVRGIRKIM